MKLIILIVKDHLIDALTRALTDAQYRVTGIASTGGFLHSGVTTLLVGVEDAQLEPAVSLIRSAVGTAASEHPQATLFVVPVLRFEQV